MTPAAASATTPSAAPQQNPLTLVMTIKSPEAAQQLIGLLTKFDQLPTSQNPINVALDNLKTVHFARFVFLENNTKLAVITTYDGSFDDYINDFVNHIGDIFNARVFGFFGEALRQAGILILGSAMVIWGMVFILGLECGIEGAYFNRSVGAPAYAGVFSAWCDLREMVPYMFGYIMSAKVGTGIVAELGAMRINEEIDALEVIGVRPITFLAATRLLAAWMVLPFVYLSAIGVGFLASYLAVVKQIGEVSSGGYFLIFWMFQNPPDLLYSVIKGMAMATAIVAVGCYYGFTASGGPVGVGQATAKSMILNMVLVHLIGMMGSQIFWGANPRAPIGG